MRTLNFQSEFHLKTLRLSCNGNEKAGKSSPCKPKQHSKRGSLQARVKAAAFTQPSQCLAGSFGRKLRQIQKVFSPMMPPWAVLAYLYRNCCHHALPTLGTLAWGQRQANGCLTSPFLPKHQRLRRLLCQPIPPFLFHYFNKLSRATIEMRESRTMW